MGREKMIGGQNGEHIAQAENGFQDGSLSLKKAGNFLCLITVFASAVAITFAPRGIEPQAKQSRLPYATIVHPQFVQASQATFLSPHDLLIGVTDGETAKAYPTAILAQHGVVQDQMAGGPIAVTW
jgi:Protein of unknown function (DUF3179)